MAKINFEFNDEGPAVFDEDVVKLTESYKKINSYPYFTGAQFPDIVEAVLTYMEEEGGDNFDELQTACRAVFADADVVPLINIITKVFEVHKYAVLRDFHLVENQEGQTLVNQELYKQKEFLELMLKMHKNTITYVVTGKQTIEAIKLHSKAATYDPSKNVYIKECDFCGTQFEASRTDTKYCSYRCQKSAGNKRWREKQKVLV